MRKAVTWILCASVIFLGTSATAKDRETPEIDPHCGAIGVTIQSRGPAALAVRPYASVAFFVKPMKGGGGKGWAGQGGL